MPLSFRGLLEAEEERGRQQEEEVHKNGGGNIDDVAVGFSLSYPMS